MNVLGAAAFEGPVKKYEEMHTENNKATEPCTNSTTKGNAQATALGPSHQDNDTTLTML